MKYFESIPEDISQEFIFICDDGVNLDEIKFVYYNFSLNVYKNGHKIQSYSLNESPKQFFVNHSKGWNFKCDEVKMCGESIEKGISYKKINCK